MNNCISFFLILFSFVGCATTDRSGSYNGDTALIALANSGDIEGLIALLENTKGLDDRNTITGETALIRASKNGDQLIVKMLIEKGARLEILDNNNYTALLWACQKGNLKAAELLLDGGASVSAVNIESPITLSVYSGNTILLKMLLDKTGDVGAKSLNGETALIAASRIGDSIIVRLLLENGASLSDVDNSHRSALHLSSRNNQIDVTKLLIKRGANTNFQDNTKKTPLHLSAQQGNFEIVRYLIDGGADVNALDLSNASPMFYAVNHNSVVNFLYNRGAVVLAVNSEEYGHLKLANSYRWLADFYENKYFTDDHNNKLDKLNAIENYERAINSFKQASLEYENTADKLAREETFELIVDISMVLTANMLSLYQAKLEAGQMANISALKSPSGKGVGYAQAKLFSFDPKVQNYRENEVHFLEQAKNFTRFSVEMSTILKCYKNKLNKKEIQICRGI